MLNRKLITFNPRTNHSRDVLCKLKKPTTQKAKSAIAHIAFFANAENKNE